MAEEIPLPAAVEVVTNPFTTTPIYPYGEILYTPPGPSQHQTPAEEPRTIQRGRKRHLILPQDNVNDRKYTTTFLSQKNIITFQDFSKTVPKQMQTEKWFHIYLKINSTAIAKPTWNKYISAFNKFNSFCKHFGLKQKWPIKKTNIYGFSLWAIETQKLNPDTIKSYLFALSKLQKLHGFKGIKVSKSPVITQLLTGAKNKLIADSPKKRRDPITFDRLIYIQQKIFESHWSEFNKQAIWCTAICAFFGSFRIGELLSKKQKTFDNTATLLTTDIQYNSYTQSVKVHIRSPKNRNPQGVYNYLFPFPDPNFCPVNSILRYIAMQKQAKIYTETLPFFRFKSGRLITTKKFNVILRTIFPPSTGLYIVGHSFRPGLISSAANLPDIVNDPHIQGWGNWSTKTFLRYQHFDTEQKRWIFNRLIQSLPKKS